MTTVEDVAPSLRDAALAYATLGWRVHPVGRDKRPLTESWIRDASTDPAVITRWWRRWPNANVAVCTGAPGPDVLDVDVKDGRGGMELFERARRAGLLRGAEAMIRTPSGGLHLWFSGTSQTGGSVGGRDRPLELKATGGYVLLPPSSTDAGTYELVERRDTSGFLDWRAVTRLLNPPAAAPPTYRRGAGNAAALAEWVGRRPEGDRNSGLFWACCTALDAGVADLEPIAAAAIANGLPEAEVRRTVASAQRRKGRTP